MLSELPSLFFLGVATPHDVTGVRYGLPAVRYPCPATIKQDMHRLQDYSINHCFL